MKLEKVGLLDAINKLVYSDEKGFLCYQIQSISVESMGKRYNLNSLYIKDNRGDFQNFASKNNIDDIKNFVWDRDYYFRNSNRGYYGYAIDEKEMLKLDINALVLNLSYNDYISYTGYLNSKKYGGYNTMNKSMDYEIPNKNFIDKKEFYIIPSEYKPLSPRFYELKVDDIYIHLKYGRVIVTKLFVYPNKDRIACQVKTNDNKIVDIQIEDVFELFYLPYADLPENKFLFLNDSLNEDKLLPYLVSKDNCYNLYWKLIDDAANYTISIYKGVQIYGHTEMYHLEDFSIDRNVGFFKIDNLLGGDFVFKLIAENRNGEKIAESRAISRDMPTFVEEEKLR